MTDHLGAIILFGLILLARNELARSAFALAILREALSAMQEENLGRVQDLLALETPQWIGVFTRDGDALAREAIKRSGGAGNLNQKGG